jgi:hypothetical protein
MLTEPYEVPHCSVSSIPFLWVVFIMCKMNTCREDRVWPPACLLMYMFHFKEHCICFDEIWCKHYAIGGHPMLCNFLYVVITTWCKCRLMNMWW